MTIAVDWDKSNNTNKQTEGSLLRCDMIHGFAVMNIYTPCEDHIYEIELPKEIDIKSP